MARVAIFETGVDPVYILSVNPGDYSSNPDAIIDPDVSLLSGVPIKYWKRSGNQVLEMTQQEKDAYEAARLLERKSLADSLSIDIRILVEALIKVINVRLPAGQKITKEEMIQALKDEIV